MGGSVGAAGSDRWRGVRLHSFSSMRTTELHFKQQGRNLLAPSVCACRNTQTHMLEHPHAWVQTHMLLLELSELMVDLACLKSTSRTEAQHANLKLTLLLFTLQLQVTCRPDTHLHACTRTQMRTTHCTAPPDKVRGVNTQTPKCPLPFIAPFSLGLPILPRPSPPPPQTEFTGTS